MTQDQRDNLIGWAMIVALAATLIGFLAMAGCAIEHVHLYTEQRCGCDTDSSPPVGAVAGSPAAPAFVPATQPVEPEVYIEVTP